MIFLPNLCLPNVYLMVVFTVAYIELYRTKKFSSCTDAKGTISRSIITQRNGNKATTSCYYRNKTTPLYYYFFTSKFFIVDRIP